MWCVQRTAEEFWRGRGKRRRRPGGTNDQEGGGGEGVPAPSSDVLSFLEQALDELHHDCCSVEFIIVVPASMELT